MISARQKLFLSMLAVVLTAAAVWAVQAKQDVVKADPTQTTGAAVKKGGSLVIAGGGSLPEQVMQTFITLSGGKDAHIVVVPTAGADADSLNPDEYLRRWKRYNTASVTMLHTRSKETANSLDFVKPLEKATGVWFGGGVQSRIADAYLGTLTEKKFHEILTRGGCIGGSSAGAAILSRVMITGGNPKPTLATGLGFLETAIVDQHFLARNRQERLMEAIRLHPNLVGIGIDEGTALVVHGDQTLEVVGNSIVSLYVSPAASGLLKLTPRMPTPNEEKIK